MKICDLTQSYAETGGGIRTYIHAKRDYLREHTGHEHLLIVPGADDRVVRDGRATTYTVASPHVPGSKVYRLLLRSDKVLRILERERPDVIECLCAYNLPWTALWHRNRHPGCLVVGGYRTDFPRAYYAGPLVTAFVGEASGRRMEKLADRYARALYSRCDFTYALSPRLLDKLREIGIPRVHLLPLGVDLDLFNPERRDPTLRSSFGLAEQDTLLTYVGRLDAEKRAHLVVDAFERLPASFRGMLLLVGAGPEEAELRSRAANNPRVRVLPFQSGRAELARILERLVNNGRERKGRRARQHVEEHFSWQRTFERLFTLYNSAGSAAGRSRAA